MILELNKQRTDSPFIELYRLQIPNDYLYFTTYHTSVYFRDRTTPFTNRLYVSLPIQFSGWEQRSEGAYARPTVSFANVLTTFSDALGDFTNDDLIGLTILRRKTLAKHLDNAAGDAHGSPAAPSESPQQAFVLDRISGINPSAVSFELASPFDVSGVTIPSRNIYPNTCSWAYQGAAEESPFTTPIGACLWNLSANNNGVTAYFDNRGALFADASVHTTIATDTAVARDDFFKVAKNLHQNELDGTTTVQAKYDYWQATAAGSTAYRRVKLYSTYNGATTYYTYKEGDTYNDVVLHANTLWSCTKTHSGGQAPGPGSSYWKRADACSKKLSSCEDRFRSVGVTNASGATISIDQDKTKVLPYGGFPASRRYNFRN